MTSEGLGEMFEGADTCAEIVFASRGSCVRRPGSEDPHQRERKFLIVKWAAIICVVVCFILSISRLRSSETEI